MTRMSIPVNLVGVEACKLALGFLCKSTFLLRLHRNGALKVSLEQFLAIWLNFLGFKPLILTSVRKIFRITVLIEDGESSHHPSSSLWDLVSSLSFRFFLFTA